MHLLLHVFFKFIMQNGSITRLYIRREIAPRRVAWMSLEYCNGLTRRVFPHLRNAAARHLVTPVVDVASFTLWPGSWESSSFVTPGKEKKVSAVRSPKTGRPVTVKVWPRAPLLAMQAVCRPFVCVPTHRSRRTSG